MPTLIQPPAKEFAPTPSPSRQLGEERIFHLDPPNDPHGGLFQRLYAKSVPSLERMLGLDKINAVYSYGCDQTSAQDFIGKCLEYLRISCCVSDEDLSRIPKSGPVVVVANHPFGAIDGLLLSLVLGRVRSDFKFMANYLLQRIPHLRELFIFVDPFGGDGSKAQNLKPMRDCLRWLGQGAMLAAFPAGEVAHRTWKDRHVTDPPWNPTIAKIIRRTGAAVLPVYFDGHNGKLFQLMGLLHPRLRTAMLPRAVFEKQGQEVEMRIGNVLSAKKLAEIPTDAALLDYLRRRTFLLQHRPAASATKRLGNGKVVPARQEAIVAPEHPAAMAGELIALPAENLLVEHDHFAVYHARAKQIPHVMHELGRLREISFRATGEGTGRSSDLDHFDDHYVHLFIWNRDAQEIVGAYRLGATDEILTRKGKAGLYSSTLFDYKQELLLKLGPALEMGRSFVRQEYQRSFSPLLMLWNGIGRYVVKNPRYRMLFGPVSISNDYQSVSRQLMVQFLREHHLLGSLAGLVRPRHPFPEQPVSGWDAASVHSMAQSDDLSELVAELEPDQKGIPILLKQYLKLGAKLLAFNLDPDFSDVVDGLIVVDLARAERRLMEKYMGKEGFASFLAHHLPPVNKIAEPVNCPGAI